MVQKRRHLAKAMTWRVGSSIITFLTVFAITDQLEISLMIAPIEIVSKFVAYYYHERLWLLSKFGLKKK